MSSALGLDYSVNAFCAKSFTHKSVLILMKNLYFFEAIEYFDRFSDTLTGIVEVKSREITKVEKNVVCKRISIYITMILNSGICSRGYSVQTKPLRS